LDVATTPRRAFSLHGQIYVSENKKDETLSAFIDEGVRIPMMSISQTELMPIRSERSDARLSQCEIVIDISQAFCLFSLS
jgi:hypothetical protein